MDQQSSNLLSIIGIAVSVGGALFTIVNHKRCRSNCFGKKLELSIDVDQTQPSPDKLTIKVPNQGSTAEP